MTNILFFPLEKLEEKKNIVVSLYFVFFVFSFFNSIRFPKDNSIKENRKKREKKKKKKNNYMHTCINTLFSCTLFSFINKQIHVYI